MLGVAAGVLAADIISKVIVVATLSGRLPIRLLGGLLTLREGRNPGAAFSIGGPSETILFTAIAVGVAIFIVRTARRIYSLPWAVALGLLLGGATGNLTDRIFRSPGPFRGWVVDWIQLPHWPVFNLADSAITCGGVLMVLLAVFGHRIDAAPSPASPGPAAPRPGTGETGAAHPAAGHGERGSGLSGPSASTDRASTDRASTDRASTNDAGPEQAASHDAARYEPAPQEQSPGGAG